MMVKRRHFLDESLYLDIGPNCICLEKSNDITCSQNVFKINFFKFAISRFSDERPPASDALQHSRPDSKHELRAEGDGPQPRRIYNAQV